MTFCVMNENLAKEALLPLSRKQNHPQPIAAL